MPSNTSTGPLPLLNLSACSPKISFSLAELTALISSLITGILIALTEYCLLSLIGKAVTVNFLVFNVSSYPPTLVIVLATS